MSAYKIETMSFHSFLYYNTYTNLLYFVHMYLILKAADNTMQLMCIQKNIDPYFLLQSCMTCVRS